MPFSTWKGMNVGSKVIEPFGIADYETRVAGHKELNKLVWQLFSRAAGDGTCRDGLITCVSGLKCYLFIGWTGRLCFSENSNL
jgi:mannosyltransferase OCH1-like enzyme